jgi:hypothetical protein
LLAAARMPGQTQRESFWAVNIIDYDALTISRDQFYDWRY